MKIHLPSITDILNIAVKTFRRFPLAISSSLIATVSAIWLIEINVSVSEGYDWLYNLSFIAALGISLFTGVQVLAYKENLSKIYSAALRAAGLLILILYYFSISGSLVDEPLIGITRYLLFFLASHLFVAIAPYLKDRNTLSFWGYNKTLFLNGLFSALYSAAMFIGLSIALLSVDELLGVDLDDEIYAQLWFFIVGVFNTWLFLSRFPDTREPSADMTEYPTPLKLFTQYVLIPIVSVYILILYAYMLKIIFQWQLPNGWVANLVLSFSIAGIFSLLLLYPIQDDKEHTWIRTYARGYYIALIPLIVLLSLSIQVRISDYGITINRYFVVILAIWLSAMVLYFLLSKKRNIRVIPASLCITALIISAGPWSAFSIAERSQVSRLQSMLNEQGYFSDAGFVSGKDEEELPFEYRKEISSIVNYLIEIHGSGSLQPIFEQPVSELLKQSGIDSLDLSDEQKVLRMMGIEYVSPFATSPDFNSALYVSLNNQWSADISGYDQMYSGIRLNSSDTLYIKDDLRISWKEESSEIQISRSGRTLVTPTADLARRIREMNIPPTKNSLPLQDMKIEVSTDELDVLIVFEQLTIVGRDEPMISTCLIRVFLRNN